MTASNRFILILPPALKEKLKAESAKTGAPQAEVIRRALESYLNARG